jgi:two-component system OmpR family sensor kinase
LRTAFDAVAGGDLDARVAPTIGSRHDELADLGRDFDRMADRLQASMNRQRRLLHDVSHEVRSPLARLQAAVGLIRLKHVAEEPAVERIEEEIARIDSLVGGLLHLSRLETGELPGTEEDIDIQELVREVVADANFEAQTMGRSVTWCTETAGVVSGRAAMLHGALENVIRNALNYATGCKDIIVETSVSDSREHYLVRVLDTGPGVPQHELADLFTPFFRSADSALIDGHGLGLAIARRAIQAHRGAISASNRRGGGLAVVITLPLKQQVTHPLTV